MARHPLEGNLPKMPGIPLNQLQSQLKFQWPLTETNSQKIANLISRKLKPQIPEKLQRHPNGQNNLEGRD